MPRRDVVKPGISHVLWHFAKIGDVCTLREQDIVLPF